MAQIQKLFLQKNFPLFGNKTRNSLIFRNNKTKSHPDSNYTNRLDRIILSNFKYIFIYLIFFTTEHTKPLYSKSSEITLTINGEGPQVVLYDAYKGPCPNYIYANNAPENLIYNIDTDCKHINIPSNPDSTLNKVKLVWESKINTARDMIKYLPNLIEVDLSKFDSSEVTSMDFMFQGDVSLKSINLQNLDTSKVEGMECMFYQCMELTELDLSSFDTSNVKQMRLMFFECFKLISLNIENFDTSNVINMEFLFFQCKELKDFSIKSFDTSKVTSMNLMFCNCYQIESLDLSMFKTNSLQVMDSMFNGCNKLKLINMSNFDTSHVYTMKNVFEGCAALNNLDISNFDTSEVIYMDNMFKNCENLPYLDLSHFHTPKLASMNEMFTNCRSLTSLNISNIKVDSANVLNSMFKDCPNLDYINFQLYIDRNDAGRLNDILVNTPENMVICINEDDTTNQLVQIIYLKICPTIYCGYNWKSKQKIILPNNTCVENHPVETKIIESTELIETTNILESTELIKTTEIFESTEIKESTTEIKQSTEKIEESKMKIPESTEKIEESTMKIPESTEKIEESTMKIPESTERIEESSSEIKESKETMKSTSISNESHFSITSTQSNKFDNNEVTIIEETFEHTSLIINENINNYTLDDINKIIYENMTNIYLQDYTGNEIVIEGKDNYLFRMTTNEQIFEMKNGTKKLSIIDLGKCEDKLRQKNNLNESISLIIISVEKDTDIASERNVQFEVYESLNKKKLNLSICDDEPIDIYIYL